MDIQVLLVIILFLLVGVMVFVSVYLVAVLKDFRETLKKTNTILDDVETITRTFSNPLVYLIKILGSVAEGVKAVRSVTSIGNDKSAKEEE